jgi:EpsI family protein
MRRRQALAVSGLILSLTLAGVLAIDRRGVPAVVQTNLERLPMEIAGFRGTEDSFSPSVYRVLNADSHLYRHYRSPEGSQVDLYIGYYGTAKGGRTGHNPSACLPGAGWAIVEAREMRITSPRHPEGVRVNYVKARKDGLNNVMLHWYQSAGDRVLANGLQMNLQRFLGRALHNRNDGAFVRVSMVVADERVPAAEAVATDFSGKILDLLPLYWPVEKG